jgi:uncharacterized membrane protein YgdD (TMEM256/DUF423 family)
MTVAVPLDGGDGSQPSDHQINTALVSAAERHESMTARTFVVLAALLGGLSVVAGAFAAHGLEPVLSKQYAGQTKMVAGESIPAARKYLGDVKTAAEYQMTHSLALLVVGLLSLWQPQRWLTMAGWSFLLGIGLFSGSLYLLVATGVTKWGAVTPIGGMLFLLGWSSLAVWGATAARVPLNPLRDPNHP